VYVETRAVWGNRGLGGVHLAKVPYDFTGITFLERIIETEDVCSKTTTERLPQLGTTLPQCYEALGMTLALLDCAAACWWGCSQGDHRLEYLLGRMANSAYAAIAMTRRGYYDQALSGARTLGEMANLLALFVADAKQLEIWKTIHEKQRRREFSAVRVRLALEQLNAPIPVDEARYAMLSGYSIHADPNNVPQAHNPLGRAITGPIYQEAGLFLALNEIALPVAFATVFVPKLLNYPDERKAIFQNTAQVLIEKFGGVNVKERNRPWFKLH
jgi:hypothetical protein